MAHKAQSPSRGRSLAINPAARLPGIECWQGRALLRLFASGLPILDTTRRIVLSPKREVGGPHAGQCGGASAFSAACQFCCPFGRIHCRLPATGAALTRQRLPPARRMECARARRGMAMRCHVGPPGNTRPTGAIPFPVAHCRAHAKGRRRRTAPMRGLDEASARAAVPMSARRSIRQGAGFGSK